MYLPNFEKHTRIVPKKRCAGKNCFLIFLILRANSRLLHQGVTVAYFFLLPCFVCLGSPDRVIALRRWTSLLLLLLIIPTSLNLSAQLLALTIGLTNTALGVIWEHSCTEVKGSWKKTQTEIPPNLVVVENSSELVPCLHQLPSPSNLSCDPSYHMRPLSLRLFVK